MDVIRRLITIHLEGVRSMNRLGLIPLHYASGGTRLELVQLLADLHPEGLRATFEKGELPIHRAHWTSAHVEVLKFLLDQYPNGA